MKPVWSDLELGPKDPILSVNADYVADTDSKKVNLVIGAYRDDTGKPVILPSVAKAEEMWHTQPHNHEYLPITGNQSFIDHALKLCYGSSAAILAEKKVAGAQCLSGTGALRVIAEFLAKFYKRSKTVYIPTPTWGNHFPVCQMAGLSTATYRYYSEATSSLDFDGLIADIQNAPEGSIILFHACAHNPTGMDPTLEQWAILRNICKAREHFVLFDTAYQGFASGDPERDAASVRMFVDADIPLAVAQSFAKNFGLYGQRVGCCSFVCTSAEENERVMSQLKRVIRPMYSNPPIYGAYIVSTVLSSPDLTSMWLEDVKAMAHRINAIRVSLTSELKRLGSTRDWSHITRQIGMFAFSGLKPEEVDRLRDEYHIYMTRDGRMSLAGLNTSNTSYVAQAIYAVTTTTA